jgi:hypothetical protein
MTILLKCQYSKAEETSDYSRHVALHPRRRPDVHKSYFRTVCNERSA